MARKLAVTELAKRGYCETLLVMNKELNNADKGYRDDVAIASCIYGLEAPRREK